MTDKDSKQMKEMIEKFGATTLEQAKLKKFDFWNTQPFPPLTHVVGSDGQLREINVENESKRYASLLTKEFEFDTLDRNNFEQTSLLYDFLNDHYINILDSKFKLHFSLEHLNWLLSSPQLINELMILVKLKSNGKIMGCIFGFLEKTQVNKNVLDLINGKLLCVHHKLRNKKMAPVLIKELIKRSILLGYRVGHYVSGRYQPKPFNSSALYFRPINTRKILDSKFMVFEKTAISTQGFDKDMEEIEKYYDITDNKLENGNFMLMQEKHLVESCNLLNSYLEKFNFHQIFNQTEFNHIFHNNDIVSSYVLCNDEGVVIDFISFYKQQSKEVSKNNFINGLYIYYYTSHEETVYQLVKNIMIIAKNNNFDIIGMFNVMENDSVINELLFTQATGINYYFWNWKCKDLVSSQIGSVPV